MNQPDPASRDHASGAAGNDDGTTGPDPAPGSASPLPVRDKADAKDEYGHSSGDRNTRTREGTWKAFKDGEQRGVSHGPETSEPAGSGPASAKSPDGHPARASGKPTD